MFKCFFSPSPRLRPPHPLLLRSLTPISCITPWSPLSLCAFSSPPPGPSLLELVKILRKETQSGISDCREALLESDKDIKKAKEWLLKKAKKIALKKSGRSVYEGGILVTERNGTGVILELNCETDFAAKEATFTGVARNLAAVVLREGGPGGGLPRTGRLDVDGILALPYGSDPVGGVEVTHVGQAIEALTGVLKENIKLRRVAILPSTPQDTDTTFVYSYVHGALDTSSPPIGRIGVLLQLHTSPPPSGDHRVTLSKLARNLCVQIAAQPPQYIYPPAIRAVPTTTNLDESVDPVLVLQEFLFDPGVTVQGALEAFEKMAKSKVVLEEFLRWELSEGIERKEADLASDVEGLLKENEETKTL